MIDINLYMALGEIKQSVKNGIIQPKEFMFDYLEKHRSRDPILYDVETTNLCNMKCIMCPRGNGLMKRPSQTMAIETFASIVLQLRPFSSSETDRWNKFCADYYGIYAGEQSENHFFCNVIAKCLTLHGWGDPLLDCTIADKIQICTDKGIPTYLSCNPANINIEQTERMMAAGLGYLKYSLDATSDDAIKAIRGKKASFSRGYQDILKVLDIKRDGGFRTAIVITMINIGGDRKNAFSDLATLFKAEDVYIYLKSENTQWLKNANRVNPSIHWSEFCQFPWSSFSILSNGDCVICSEDYDGEVKLGNINDASLIEIWNGSKVKQIREAHIYRVGISTRCAKCDMKAFYKLAC